LRANLAEIRAEINRIVGASDRGEIVGAGLGGVREGPKSGGGGLMGMVAGSGARRKR
jgi:hypothetical protein